MITFLSGGTGTPKLVRGFRKLYNDSDISVVVNTAEDMWVSGNHLSPDIDTVMYLFAGILNTDTWWGIEDDTTITNDFLNKMGENEFITVGDQDRAVHIARAAMLKRGLSLTESTKLICRELRVYANVLPMTDQEVTTFVTTPDTEMHFQEYWVKKKGRVEITGVKRRCKGESQNGGPCKDEPAATPEVIDAIESADSVIIGPSNPVTSISPILECSGVREALKKQFVIVMSPFIGDTPISGPAKALMEAWGLKPTSRGTYNLYKDFLDIFIQDTRDTDIIPGAVVLDTLMLDEKISIELAESVNALIKRE
ncbi:MAG: 2-phospho-L-lactate transferase [Methanogenium sp.]|nr:2-phospho-L-lactate transferase [Methanogenium sp.]